MHQKIAMIKYYQTDGTNWMSCFTQCIAEWIGKDRELSDSLYDLEDGDTFSMDGLTCKVSKVDNQPVMSTWLH